jgi:tRNA U34 5-methylaminomethyl-2-thiouridine-forming methyltransferase MnmC
MPEIIWTADGSTTVFGEEINETYHSKNGALSESEHVFIQNGLLKLNLNELTILEVGLGTGLNALLTANHAHQTQTYCKYYAIEPYPLEANVLKKCSFASMPYFDQLHSTGDGQTNQIHPFFSLSMHQIKLEEASFPDSSFDLIYFDAFSSQREIWCYQNLEKCYGFLKSGGLWVSYSAKGQLKRDLRALGFEVENPKGAIGKLEMTRAKK